MKEKIQIIVTIQHSGILLSAIYQDEYFKQLYNGYTLKEAKRLFKDYIELELSLYITAK